MLALFISNHPLSVGAVERCHSGVTTAPDILKVHRFRFLQRYCHHDPIAVFDMVKGGIERCIAVVIKFVVFDVLFDVSKNMRTKSIKKPY